MKALRYLLMVVAMVSFLSVRAQGLAEQPNAQMHSTSVMEGAGSTLPQAAIEGVTTTESPKPSIRKIGGGNSGGGPDDREDPYADPLGDAGWPLALLAIGYAIYSFARKRT